MKEPRRNIAKTCIQRGSGQLPVLRKLLMGANCVRNLLTLALDAGGLSKSERIYSLRGPSGGKIKMLARGGTADYKEIVAVFSGYEYDLSKLPPMNNPVIFDAGAHIGSFTLYALDYYTGKNPHITSVEPLNENFSYLVKNLSINSSTHAVNAIKKAVGTREGQTGIFVTKSRDSNKIADINAQPPSKYIRMEHCEVSTPALLAGYQKIDILKMDIEGSENDIMTDSGCMDFIANRVSHLFIELHGAGDGPPLDSETAQAIIKRGFRPIYLRGRTALFSSCNANRI